MTNQTKEMTGRELEDLLLNTGILHEANRTFFHALGLNLKLKGYTLGEEKIELALEETDDKKGFILHTIDKFKMQTFRKFRTKKHEKRLEKVSFIIQTQDMIREHKIEDDLKITPPKTLKLNKLLRCVDETTYIVKKRLMEKSPELDGEVFDIDWKKLRITSFKDLHNQNYVDLIAKSIIRLFKDDIKKELENIKEIEKKQNEVFKKGVENNG